MFGAPTVAPAVTGIFDSSHRLRGSGGVRDEERFDHPTAVVEVFCGNLKINAEKIKQEIKEAIT